MSFFREEVKYRLREKPWLHPVWTSTHAIPERLRQYDPSLFVVRNTLKHWFEVHSLNNEGDTFAFITNKLDARVEYKVRKGNLRERGNKIFREIDEHNAKLERGNNKQFRSQMRDIAKDTASAFAKFAWEEL